VFSAVATDRIGLPRVSDAVRFHRVSFYLVTGYQLVLGPFQGPDARGRIPPGRTSAV